MKYLPITTLAIATLISAYPQIGNCGGPLSRVFRCKAKTNCAPPCAPSDMGTADNPSPLNIMMTEELVILRARVEEMKAVLDERDQLLGEAQAEVAKLQDENAQLTKRVTRQTERTKEAEAKLITLQKSMEDQQKAAEEAAVNSKQQLQQLRKRNATLQNKVKEGAVALQAAAETLEKQRQDRKQEEDKQQGIEAPPAAIKEDEGASASDQKAGDTEK